MVRPNQLLKPAAAAQGVPTLPMPDWQHEQPVPLLKNVLRLTAPNPSTMTGPGTNSYLVGDPACGYLVIDPGPDEPAHIERLWQAASGNIRLIVCTHSHADHAPGARPLQTLCKNRGVHPHPNPLPEGEGAKPVANFLPPLPPGEGRGEGSSPILGLPSAPTARAASHFLPDRALADGERLQLTGAAGMTHTLRVIHTPGHAANHLCLLLEEDGLLFSGDHILQGSTTVIDPPDGDMSDYLDSLDKLAAACAAHGVTHILPAHGHVMAEPASVIARLKAHRLQREARVLQAMRERPDGSLDDWLPLAYADTPPSLWPLARRSLLAHLQRIERMHPAATPKP